MDANVVLPTLLTKKNKQEFSSFEAPLKKSNCCSGNALVPLVQRSRWWWFVLTVVPSSQHHQVPIKVPFWLCSFAATIQRGAIWFLQVDCLFKDNHLCSTNAFSLDWCMRQQSEFIQMHPYTQGTVTVLLNKQPLLLYWCIQNYKMTETVISVFSILGNSPR